VHSSSPEKLKDHHQQEKGYQSECFNDWSEIDSKKDRGENLALAHSNIDIKVWRRELIPGVGGGMTCVITVKETHDISVKTCFL